MARRTKVVPDDRTITLSKLAKELAGGNIGDAIAKLDLSSALGPINEQIRMLSESFKDLPTPHVEIPERHFENALPETLVMRPEPVNVNVDLDYDLLAAAILDVLDKRIRDMVALEVQRQFESRVH